MEESGLGSILAIRKELKYEGTNLHCLKRSFSSLVA